MFITRYADYASKIIAVPREVHEIVAAQLVGSAICDNVDLKSNPLDLWVLLTGDAESARSIAQIACPIAKLAGLTDVFRMNEWGSIQAMDQDIAARPSGLYVWGDLADRLKCDGLEQWLKARHDTYRIPGVAYKQPPRMNILATVQEDWYFENLKSGAHDQPFYDPFLVRWELLPGISGDIEVGAPDEDEAKALGKELRRIWFVEGTADTRAIDGHYWDWHRAIEERFMEKDARARLHYHERNALKLAVLVEAATSYGVTVTRESWAHAVRIAGKMEETLFAGLKAAPQLEPERPARRIEEKILRAGASGLPLSMYTRAYQRLEDRGAQLKALINDGRVRVESRSTAGRPAKFLVHRDFWDSTSFNIIQNP